MPLADDSSPSTQMPLLGVTAGPCAHSPTGSRRGRSRARERVTVDLRGLASRLNVYADACGRTPAAVIRLALVQAMDAGPTEERRDAHGAEAPIGRSKVTLRISTHHAARLVCRARASEMSQGAFVCALLDGESPAPIPEIHGAAVEALTASTDHLAVLSSDLNGFLRSVGKLPNVELVRYRASIVSVVEEVRKHLSQASALIAEVRAARRGRP